MNEIAFFVVAGAWALVFITVTALITAAVEFIITARRNGVPFGWLGRCIRAARFERQLKKPLTAVKLNWRKK